MIFEGSFGADAFVFISYSPHFGKYLLKMDKEEKEELENEIRKGYPGITQKDITLMLSFFDMMQAHTKEYQK